jgi:hypothetical protein
MKTAIGNDDLRHEWYVVEIDGTSIPCPLSNRSFPLSKVQSFVSAVWQFWKATAYHPERHYMRGPGPKGVRSTKMNLTLKHAIAAIDRVRYRATCRRLRSVSNGLCVRGTSSCGGLGAVCLMRIIVLVERNVCELAHTNSVFCADAPTTRPAQGGAPRLSTLRWVDDAKGKLLSQVGDQN